MRRFVPCLLAAGISIGVGCTEKIVYIDDTTTAAPQDGIDAGDLADATRDGGGDASPPPKETDLDPSLIDLGTVKTGEDVPFDLPQGALGFNIVVEGSASNFSEENPFGIERIVTPTGKVVHDSFAPVGGDRMMSFAEYDTLAAASVPQSEAAPTKLPAGKWTVRFGFVGLTSKRTSLSAKVRVQRSSDGVFHGGRLDLHVHVPQGLRIEGTTVNPKKAQDDSRLTDRIDTFFALTEELLGIERGEVSFHPAAAKFAELDDEEIFEGFTVSKGAVDGTPALHVLLTNAIRYDGESIAAGISPGIPGAANTFGRNISGIIAVPYGEPEVDAHTILHEFGHFVGLNHTTEFTGENADPLADTPRCLGEITYETIESCPDIANVMFPAGPLEYPQLSPTQKRIYRGSPIYKTLLGGTRSSAATRARRPMAHANRTASMGHLRASGAALSPVERELAFGSCGLELPNAKRMIERHGSRAIDDLRAAANDQDLAAFVRGRARLALRQLGEQP